MSGLIASQVSKKPVVDAVDTVVARFTKGLLGLANKENVPFEYAGNKGSQSAEILRTMEINSKVVKALLGRKD